MKKYFLSLGLSFLFFASYSQIMVGSEIKEVTVFLNGAQINREAKIQLKKGINEIVFENLSQYLNANSIQLKSQDNFTIVSVNSKTNFIKRTVEGPEVEETKKKWDKLQSEMELVLNEIQLLSTKKSMILTNKTVGSKNALFDIDALYDLSDYYASELLDLEYELLKAQDKKKDLQNKINILALEYNKLKNKLGQPTSEVSVKIASDFPQTVNAILSYMVRSAGWEPFYDVRTDNITGPVNLTYKGNIFQTTGYDWNNVKLTLSTGNPTVSGTRPDFKVWKVWYSEYDNSRGKGVAAAYDSGNADKSSYSRAEDEKSRTIVKEAGVNTEFIIDLPYTILSDGRDLAVEVKKHNLPASYKYVSIPRLDESAFLLAQITGWDDLYLLSGQANIYYEGTYVGNSYIDASVTTDTLEISLGRDNGIVVERERVNELSEIKTSGGNKKISRGMQVSIRNTKNTTITLVLTEGIPVSTNKELEIELTKDGGAKLLEDENALQWILILGPGETKKVQYQFTAKFPKEKIIYNF